MRLAGRPSDVLRPFPPWLIGGAAHSHAGDAHDFKPTLVKGADFVGFLKPFENNCRVDHWLTLLCASSYLNVLYESLLIHRWSLALSPLQFALRCLSDDPVLS